jgi:hypothetical protein
MSQQHTVQSSFQFTIWCGWEAIVWRKRIVGIAAVRERVLRFRCRRAYQVLIDNCDTVVGHLHLLGLSWFWRYP